MDRAAILAKSGGRCWYCGCGLNGTRWHADHVEPVIRGPNGVERPEHDTADNLVPACAPCNRFKGVFTVEGFRTELEAQVERARKSSVNFRMAERFGLIEVVKPRVTFWFETPDAMLQARKDK